jgi:hypothetical protein
MAFTEESNEHGSPIYRYSPRDRPSELPTQPGRYFEAIVRHISTHIGKPFNVYHEVVDGVLLMIHMVAPTTERPFFTLVTSGMSDLPMHVPSGVSASHLAELLLCLPPDWPLDRASLTNDRYFWPIRWLMLLANFPHYHDSRLGIGHTMPCMDPPQRLAPDTLLCGMLIFTPILLGKAVQYLQIDDHASITFYSVMPLYKEEMYLKLARGFDVLLARMAKGHLTELIDLQRPNLGLLSR